ncbi:hypothetical protein V6N13_123514 [Hibiscus sabdariffa]
MISIFIIFWRTHAEVVADVPARAPSSTSIPESQPDLDTTVDATILNVLDYLDVSDDEIIELTTEVEVFDLQSNNSSMQQVDDKANKDVEPPISNYPHVEIEPRVEIENENVPGHRTSPVNSNGSKVIAFPPLFFFESPQLDIESDGAKASNLVDEVQMRNESDDEASYLVDEVKMDNESNDRIS